MTNRDKDLKDIAKDIRNALKSHYPEWKFSVTIARFAGGQSLSVALMSGPRSPFGDKLTYPNTYDGIGMRYPINGYAQLNHFYIEQKPLDDKMVWVSNGTILTEEAAKMLKEVTDIANRENWDYSDAMTDYFDVNYFLYIEIGKWDRPFTITTRKNRVVHNKPGDHQ